MHYVSKCLYRNSSKSDRVQQDEFGYISYVCIKKEVPVSVSLGRCDEFSSVCFLIKPVSAMPRSHTNTLTVSLPHTQASIHTRTHT